MNFIEAKILWDYTLERFTELLPSGATMRLAASYCGPPQLAILGNLYVLKSAIELLLLVTHQVTIGPIVCSFEKGEGDSWRLQVEGQFSWNQSLKMALERCVNGVLGSSAQKAQFAFAPERIEVEFTSITPQALAFSP